MRYLIDTHVCLWAISETEKLSKRVGEILRNPDNEIFVSEISLFEVVIKLKIGKLPDFKATVDEFIESITDTGFKMLPLKIEHILSYNTIDFPEQHRDPFDRILLATATFESLSFITIDEKFRLYDKIIDIVW